jgi:hypothetical protein
MKMALSKFDLSLVIEALRSARCEIETLENSFDEYVTTGRLVDQLVAAEAILVKEKARRAAKAAS